MITTRGIEKLYHKGIEVIWDSEFPKGGSVMDYGFIKKKWAEIYPNTADFVLMQEVCATRTNSYSCEAEWLFLALQDRGAALSLAKEYAEWKKE